MFERDLGYFSLGRFIGNISYGRKTVKQKRRDLFRKTNHRQNKLAQVVNSYHFRRPPADGRSCRGKWRPRRGRCSRPASTQSACGDQKTSRSVLLAALMFRLTATKKKRKRTNAAWRCGSGGSSSRFSACPVFCRPARFDSPVQTFVCSNRKDVK